MGLSKSGGYTGLRHGLCFERGGDVISVVKICLWVQGGDFCCGYPEFSDKSHPNTPFSYKRDSESESDSFYYEVTGSNGGTEGHNIRNINRHHTAALEEALNANFAGPTVMAKAKIAQWE